jgi:TatD DNase family protein
MDYAYSYGDSSRLYLNVTNKCTNNCLFCIRNYSNGLGGVILRGEREPDVKALRESVLAGNQFANIAEFIWCGFGEPTFRLELIFEMAAWLRSAGAKIRLNTNGHANLIHGRDVLPELAKAVDEVSISLNAPDRARYKELCRPQPGGWESLLDFLSRAPVFFRSVQASVVGFVLTSDEVERSREIALSYGIEQFRVR